MYHLFDFSTAKEHISRDMAKLFDENFSLCGKNGVIFIHFLHQEA